MGWDGHEAGRGCRHDGASPSYKCFTCMPRHFCYPWLTPACFALLLACSCGRFWCQLLALVSPNCVFEAVWARPLVRPAVLERSSDHLGFVKARCFVVVGHVAVAAREKIATAVAGLTQRSRLIHVPKTSGTCPTNPPPLRSAWLRHQQRLKGRILGAH